MRGGRPLPTPAVANARQRLHSLGHVPDEAHPAGRRERRRVAHHEAQRHRVGRVDAVRLVEQPDDGPPDEARTGEEHDRQRDLAGGQGGPEAPRGSGRGDGGPQGGRKVAACGLERGRGPAHERHDEGDDGAGGEHGQVDRHRVEAREDTGGDADEDPDEAEAHPDADDGGCNGDDQAFGKHAANQVPRSGAERQADGDVMAAGERAADEERCHVCARHEQHQEGGPGERAEHRPHLTGQDLVERCDDRPRAEFLRIAIG